MNGSHVVNVPLIQQTNVYKYSLDSESDSEENINTEVLSNDLEKNNACCAAFTVVFLIILYFQYPQHEVLRVFYNWPVCT